MKHMRHITMHSILLLWALVSSSCVNPISVEEDSGAEAGDVPISFRVSMQGATTRLSSAGFTSGDRMGLYATVGSEGLGGTRYIDNLEMEALDDGQVRLATEVFYPQGGHRVNFWSYYPYRSKALSKGQTGMEISVKSDQQTARKLSDSHFLAGSLANVSESSAAVPLVFNQKLAKIRLSLKPAAGTTPEELLAKGISSVATGFCTTADYDFPTDAVSNPRNKQDILICDDWKVSGDSLTGGCFLIVPQDASNQQIVLEIGGNQQVVAISYTGNFGAGKQVCLQTALDKDSPSYMKGIVTSITDWEEDAPITGSGDVNQQAVHLSTLRFNTSGIYRLYYNGMPVSEICKEYIRNADTELQAIVHYPLTGEVADLEKETVLQILGQEEEAVHGGTLQWNAATGMPTYTPGTRLPISEFQVTANGNLSEESGVTVLVSAYTISDRRGGTERVYPIVKIGTQYWLAADLATTKYRNGTDIPLLAKPNGTAGYLKDDTQMPGHRYYTGEAVCTNLLAPSGCRVASRSDWERLKAYVGAENAGVLKSGDWLAEEGVGMSNLTGLSIQPKGLYTYRATQTGMISPRMFVYYWMVSDTVGVLPTDTTNAVAFSYRENSINTGKRGWDSEHSLFHALSVRCLVAR